MNECKFFWTNQRKFWLNLIFLNYKIWIKEIKCRMNIRKFFWTNQQKNCLNSNNSKFKYLYKRKYSAQ